MLVLIAPRPARQRGRDEPRALAHEEGVVHGATVHRRAPGYLPAE